MNADVMSTLVKDDILKSRDKIITALRVQNPAYSEADLDEIYWAGLSARLKAKFDGCLSAAKRIQ